MGDMMTTRDVAAYLRIKERKVYELVKTGAIPCTRVTGKWLFPRDLIDQWVSAGARLANAPPAAPPPVIAGSHDPLLEWCVNQAGCGLALLPGGSLDGLERLAAGEAAICGLHVLDTDSGEYNLPLLRKKLSTLSVVAVEWTRRAQGLVVAGGNPLGLNGIADLRDKGARIIPRQSGAGSQILFEHLADRAGVALADLDLGFEPARNETELALAVLEGKADAGVGVGAVAHQLKLGFIPLARERYDLVMRRRDYFEPPFQRLLATARAPAFAERAAELGGYDISGLGAITYNGP